MGREVKAANVSALAAQMNNLQYPEHNIGETGIEKFNIQH